MAALVWLLQALTGVTYHYYAPAGSCSLNIFFVTWNLVLGLLMVGVLLVPGRAATAGLLTSGAVWLYCSYLTYSALASEPANSCIRGGGVSAGGWVGVVAFFIALAAVIYSTLDAGAAAVQVPLGVVSLHLVAHSQAHQTHAGTSFAA